MRVRPGGSAAVWALGAIVFITIVWWVLALWPVPMGAPEWVGRYRALCFGVRPGGGPNLAGWLLIIGEPLAMLGILVTVWGRELRDGLRPIAQRWGSSLGLTIVPLVVLALIVLARSASERGGELFAVMEAPGAISDFPRLDRDAPPLALVNQHGDTVHLEQFRGRPVLVTFAYGHCETVCPLAVHDVLVAERRLSRAAPAVLIVTVDPWRDTPARLASIASGWELPADAHLLSGSVAAVEATLDAWGVPRARKANDGEIVHSSVVTLIDRRGRIAYTVTGGAEAIEYYARRL
jgi:protein SCO1/2